MKTILVPIDFSPASQAAIDVAAGIARKVNGKLTLLHIIEEIAEGSFNVEGQVSSSVSWENRLFTMRMIQKARKQLGALEGETKKNGINASTLLRLGDTFHGIQTIITEQKADLVVMGTKGSSGLNEVMVGSNTEKVVRRSSCPVLSVSKKPLRDEFKSIVWATTLQKEEEPFADVVKSSQEIYNGTIHMVRINTPGVFISDLTVKNKMQAFAKQLRLKNYTLNVFNDYTEEEGIIHFAESIDADLIAMATHGRTGLGHLLSGSIAEDVVNHSRRPVLTYGIGKKKSKGNK